MTRFHYQCPLTWQLLKSRNWLWKNVMNVVKSVDIRTFYLQKEKNKCQSGNKMCYFLFQLLKYCKIELKRLLSLSWRNFIFCWTKVWEKMKSLNQLNFVAFNFIETGSKTERITSLLHKDLYQFQFNTSNNHIAL